MPRDERGQRVGERNGSVTTTRSPKAGMGLLGAHGRKTEAPCDLAARFQLFDVAQPLRVPTWSSCRFERY